MIPLLKGRYTARFAETRHDIEAAQRLRYLAFIVGSRAQGAGLREDGLEADVGNGPVLHSPRSPRPGYFARRLGRDDALRR